MIYSVWDWNEQQYHLYKANGEKPGQRPIPYKTGNGIKSTGVQPEAILTVLPHAAKRVGSSKKAKGKIAVHYNSPAAALGQYTDPRKSPLVKDPALTLGLGALAIIAVYRTLVILAKRL